MRIVVSGANGFLGRNLISHLGQLPEAEVLPLTRATSAKDLITSLQNCDIVYHLAGVNRPSDESEFVSGNVGYTQEIVNAMERCGNRSPIVYASSIQASHDAPYGASKRHAEDCLRALSRKAGNPVHIYRLPNVFGKWSRPNYNSVVATFCHNVARGLPIRIDDPESVIRLAYVDDVVRQFLRHLSVSFDAGLEPAVAPVYEICVGELAKIIYLFKDSRTSLTSENVGTGLHRALWATWLSTLPSDKFTYEIPVHSDSRGAFVEILKTKEAGQFSYFTAYPGVTRGGHYHHTKTEKFLVVRGNARFRFKQLQSGDVVERYTSDQQPEVVETIPGWWHDVTNVGDGELVVLLWASEIFDRNAPDTFSQVKFNG